ncbi:MAG: efflux RND transporter periplasmic adaptor subunit [Gemmatimonadaceae bacterium]
MSRPDQPIQRFRLRALTPLLSVVVTAIVLGAWKYSSIQTANAASASQPEPVEVVAAAVATPRTHRETATSIGTVIAPRSISLRNEVPGTVRQVALRPGQVVEAGSILVALDVSVEAAELRAQDAQAKLAETQLARTERMTSRGAASAMELDNARAERDIALAQMARTRAIIARKTIRAPFRARVGISDVHAGQFLETGTPLTTLQGVEGAVHVDFSVAQTVAAGLRVGDQVQVFSSDGAPAIAARINAVDARVDPTTRNAFVRAELPNTVALPAPGSSVRVQVNVGPVRSAVAVPVSALRKGPGGDHVFVIAADKNGKTRAQLRLVSAGPVLGDEIVVVDGLRAGEKVAASGSFKLRDAVLVAVADTAATAAVKRVGLRQ